MRITCFFLPFLLCCSSLVAHSDTVNFQYNDGLFSGTGSFSYSFPSTTIHLFDLADFDFSLTVSNPKDSPNFYAIFRPMTLASLNSFSATLIAGSLTSLSLDTAFADPISSNCGEGCAFGPEEFHVANLEAYTCAVCSDLFGETLVSSSGTVTQTGFSESTPTVIPEPTPLALIGTGAVGLIEVARGRLCRLKPTH